jgi:hypothetical protein
MTLWPHQPTLENYRRIFTDESWYSGYINSLNYVIINTVISIAVALPAAYGFSRYRFLGDKHLFFWLLSNRMAPAAVFALPHGPEPDEADPVTARAHERAVELLDRLGWESEPVTPPHRMLVASLATLLRLGYPCGLDRLLPYGRAAGQIADVDVSLIDEGFEPGTTQLEAAVALTVLYEPVLLSLRRLAHSEEALRRFRDDAGAQ